MKELVDGTQVTSRGYYFLLDWNDKNNKKIMTDLYDVNRQYDLTKHQYVYLMKRAMSDELKGLGDHTQV